MTFVKFQSRSVETDKDGNQTRSVVYGGSLDEMSAMISANGTGAMTENGTVSSSRMYQGEGSDLWYAEIRYESSGSDSVEPPGQAWGQKSVTVDAAMLSMPLETHKDYALSWNYYLITCAPSDAVPEWYTKGRSTIIGAANEKYYKLLRSLSEVPVSPDSQGREWRTLAEPEMPGVNNYDVATYVLKETVRAKNQKAAAKLCVDRVNRIIDPYYDCGITGGDWKCDSANFSWNGKYWLVTLTYTRSGDEKGWNKKLYGAKKTDPDPYGSQQQSAGE